MKHPALARVFSVVLAILGLILLAVGIRGFGKNTAEHTERLAYADKFAGRIENYRQLHEQLENAADYDETMTALRTFVTEHDKAAAKHKTDTAIYSATKGGLRMGEDMIVAASAQLDDLRRQMHDATARRAFLEGLLTELIASNKDKMPWLGALANRAAGYAVDCYSGKARVMLLSGKLRALMDSEPQPSDFSAAVYTPPEAPPLPELPAIPALGGLSLDAAQAVYQAAADQYLGAAAAYQQAGEAYAEQMQAYFDDAAQREWDRLNQLRDQAMGAVTEAAYSAEYRLAHAAWERECKAVKKEADFAPAGSALRRLSLALSTLVRQANSMMSTVAAETGGVYPGFEELSALALSTADRLDALAGSDLSGLSNEEFLRLTDTAEEVLDLLCDAFCCIASNLNNPAGLLTELLERLHVTELLVKYLDGMLEKAEQQMQAALEELWYQLGETEKDYLKLEAEKLGLDKEAKLLASRTMEADTLRDLRSRHATARQLLVNVPEVKSGMRSDDDLLPSARAYLDTYRQRTAALYRGNFVICLLAVLGGALGIASFPAAYELFRSRLLLLSPPLLCLGCAAGAEALSVALGLGQMYPALFTAIFALVHLLIVLPRQKKPRHRPQHLLA